MSSVDPRINEIVGIRLRNSVSRWLLVRLICPFNSQSWGTRTNIPILPKSARWKREIRHRFNQKTTNPPVISDDDIDKNSHTDKKIDGSWFDQLDDDAFTNEFYS